MDQLARLSALLGLAAVGVGCDGPDTNRSLAGDGGGADATLSCPGPGYPSSDAPHVVSSIVGKVVDLDGAPVARTLALLCGVDICIYGSTDEQGTVVTCDSSEPPVCTSGIGFDQPIRRPAFKYGDGLGTVKLAQPLATDRDSYDLGAITTAVLPPLAEGAPLSTGIEATSSGVTIAIPAGGSLEIDALAYATEDERRFRAVAIPLANAPPAVDPALGFEIVIGTSPVDARFCPEATLSVPNTAAWPADTAVEFWLHGVDPGQDWAPYAGWAKVSEGRVSSDGQRIVTLDGDGIPALSVFGIRRR